MVENQIQINLSAFLDNNYQLNCWYKKWITN